MKIILSGPQGSGKTTLMKALADIPFFTERFELLPEVVRSLKAKYEFNINELASMDTELIVLTQHVQNLILKKSFISDRGLPDNYVYTSLVNSFSPQGEVISEQYLKSSYSIMEELVSKYDLICYVPNEFPLEEDGIRNIDISYVAAVQKRFDALMKFLKEVKKVNVVTLTGTVEERIEQLKQAIIEKESK